VNGLDDESKETVLRMLDRYKQMDGSITGYVTVDVPMEFYASSDQLLVRRADGEGLFSEGLRNTAFLEMHRQVDPSNPIAEKRYDQSFASDYYNCVPLLTRSSTDIYRLNQFAPVLGLLRLAKASGANCVEPADAVVREATPDQIAVAISDLSADPVILPVSILKGRAAALDEDQRIGTVLDQLSTNLVKGTKNDTVRKDIQELTELQPRAAELEVKIAKGVSSELLTNQIQIRGKQIRLTGSLNDERSKMDDVEGRTVDYWLALYARKSAKDSEVAYAKN